MNCGDCSSSSKILQDSYSNEAILKKKKLEPEVDQVAQLKAQEQVQASLAAYKSTVYSNIGQVQPAEQVGKQLNIQA